MAAPGRDKIIFFDPPGSIGIVDGEPIFAIRFEEASEEQRPQDDGKVCRDFDPPDGYEMPPLVNGVLGRARSFDGLEHRLASQDIDPGATLLTRDATIQVVMAWNSNQEDGTGDIVARGIGFAAGASETTSFCLRLDTVSVPENRGLLRWYWEGVDGTPYQQDGFEIELGLGQFTLLTATRRWIAPDKVELRYYVGDQLLGIATSEDGDIGGSILGHMTIGGGPGSSIKAVIDELAIFDRELCLEEIEATWLRITRYQPLGVRLLKEQIDPRFPLPTEPESDPQLELRRIGMALGYAAAQTENLRANFLPQRAYGSTLDQWEEASKPSSAPAIGIEERRQRVLARLRQSLGSSIPGLEDALSGLIDTNPENLEFLAFSNLIEDDFTTFSGMRWYVSPDGGVSHEDEQQIDMSLTVGDHRYVGTVTNWTTVAMPVSQPATPDTLGEEHALVELGVSISSSGSEFGLFLADRAHGHYLLLGIRNTAGVIQVVAERFKWRVSRGTTVIATLPGGNPAGIWLYLHEEAGEWIAGWSITGPDSLQMTTLPSGHPTFVPWAGFYGRSIGMLAAPAYGIFDSYKLFTPKGTRPLTTYVLIPEELGNSPDIQGAQANLDEVRHGYVNGAVIVSRDLRCDAEETPCDRGPMGGL